MRHRLASKKFGRKTGHRNSMYRGMVTSFLKNGHLRTTQAKAKRVRSLAEKMVTLGKNGSLHDRRQAATFITEPGVLSLIFDDLAEKYRERPGGYTRLVKLGTRKGDSSDMALLELV